MAFGMDMGPDSVVNIKVIGVGGGGNNVVNRIRRTLILGKFLKIQRGVGCRRILGKEAAVF